MLWHNEVFLICRLPVSLSTFMQNELAYFFLGITLFTLIPAISAGVRRLHDTNKSGLWYLLTFTIIGIIPLIYFYSLKGDETKNNYNY